MDLGMEMRVAIADELTTRERVVTPDDIRNIDVRWDNGDRSYCCVYDGDYPNQPPTLTVEVTLDCPGGSAILDTEFALTTLFRALMGMPI